MASAAASTGQEQGILGRNQERPLTVAGLAGEFEAVAGEPVLAIAVREVLEVMAEKTQSTRQPLRAQRMLRQVWEVCMLAGAEWASGGLETPPSSGVAQTRR